MGGDLYDDSTSGLGTTNSLIPEGFLYLKNVTTGEVYINGDYYYMDESSIKVGNIELENLNDTYCLITVGTDITSSIQDLNMKTFKHSHNREFGEQPISFKDLVGATEEDGLSGVFVESRHDGNYLAWYLHRDGYSARIVFKRSECNERSSCYRKENGRFRADTVPGGGRIGGL